MARPETLSGPLPGIERAMLISSSDAAMLEVQSNFIKAAHKAEVKYIVKLSGIMPEIDSPFQLSKACNLARYKMGPIVLFGIQFTLSLVAYALIAFWYVRPRLSRLPREAALVPLLWVHAFRIVGGTILAPGAVEAGVPMGFRVMIGYGDLATAFLALVALIALRARFSGAIALVWLCVVVGNLDTVNAIIQSIRDNVFSYALGFNWVIVAIYVPALLVSSLLIFMQLLSPNSAPGTG